MIVAEMPHCVLKSLRLRVVIIELSLCLCEYLLQTIGFVPISSGQGWIGSWSCLLEQFPHDIAPIRILYTSIQRSYVVNKSFLAIHVRVFASAHHSGVPP